LGRARAGRAIHSGDDELDELSAQLRFQMAAPDTLATLDHGIGVPQHEAVGLPSIRNEYSWLRATQVQGITDHRN
jgi:hypothetical protein